jgi:hypothetical protein
MERINTRLIIISGMALIFTARSHSSSGREKRPGTADHLGCGALIYRRCLADVGFRHAIVNGAGVNEVRAGLTVGFPLRLLSGPLHK